MARKQPFHAISVRQHTVVVLFFCSYLRTYAPRPTHPEQGKTHIIRERNGILNHYKFNNCEPCGTGNPKTPVGIGRIIGCLLKRNLLQSLSTIYSYGSHIHKHTVSGGVLPIELASRGAPEIDDTLNQNNRYTTLAQVTCSQSCESTVSGTHRRHITGEQYFGRIEVMSATRWLFSRQSPLYKNSFNHLLAFFFI